MRGLLQEAGFLADAEFLPNISRAEKIDFLKSLTVFSVPATYGESFGLYLLEAWAAGVPVVQPRHAAFPELLDLTGGGLLCEPNDPHALAAALERLFCDAEQARELGCAGQRAVYERFHVERMAQDVLSVFEQAARNARRA
jgi:glycosyltransferase involved in cell wall biosynthesis